MFSSAKYDAQNMLSQAGVEGIFEMVVRKADGSIRKQFAEWKLFAWLRKKNIRIPKIMFLTGRMANSVTIKNLVTNAGFAGIAARIGADAVEAAFDYLAVGTGTTAANASNTTLETEITDSGLARAQGTDSRTTTTVTNDTLNINYTWTASGSKAITECGLLNAGSSGTLLGRNVFSAVNVVSSDSFELTYKVKVA